MSPRPHDTIADRGWRTPAPSPGGTLSV